MGFLGPTTFELRTSGYKTPEVLKTMFSLSLVDNKSNFLNFPNNFIPITK